MTHRKSLTFAERHCENDVSSVFLFTINISEIKKSDDKSEMIEIFMQIYRDYIRNSTDTGTDDIKLFDSQHKELI